MSKLPQHITPELLKAYVNGELSPAERYGIERAALRDSAVRDALEGYEYLHESKTDFTEVTNRLKNSLQQRLEKPTKKSPIIWWKYGIAASLLFGLFAGSYLIFSKLDKEEVVSKIEETSNEEALPPAPIPQNEVEVSKDKSTTEEIKPLPKRVLAEQKSAEAIQIFEAPPPPLVINDVVTEKSVSVLEEAEIVALSENINEKKNPSAGKEVVKERVLSKAKTAEDLKGDLAIVGKVTDAQNEPLSGVSVAVKGKNINTQTDAGGKFSLRNVSPIDYIQLSYVGFEQKEIKAKEATTPIILTEDAAVLSEVIVTGNGEPMPDQTAFPVIGWKAFRNGLELKGNKKGKVILLLTISPNGDVVKKEIKKGMGELYDTNALNLPILNSSWMPTRRDGVAVEEKVRVVVRVKI